MKTLWSQNEHVDPHFGAWFLTFMQLVLPSVATLRDHMASLSWLLWNQTMLFGGTIKAGHL